MTGKNAMKLDIPESLLSIKPYPPGKPMEEVFREYGLTDVVKLASNENPLGPSSAVIEAITRTLPKIHRYPDGSGYELLTALSGNLGISKERLIIGNGSDEIIGMLATALLRPGVSAVLPEPSFLMYEIMIKTAGAEAHFVPLKNFAIDLPAMKEKITDNTRLVFLTHPNNPTGSFIKKDEFEWFMEGLPENVVVISDEAYIEFARDKDAMNSLQYIDKGYPVVTLRTFSKVYGLAGLRIGYGIMDQELADVLNRFRQPFNTNILAQAAACAALNDTDYLEKTVSLIHREIDFLYAALSDIGVSYVPSQSNFILIEVKGGADKVFKSMLKKGVIVRSMSSYGYPDHIRVNAGLHEENVRFVNALEETLKGL